MLYIILIVVFISLLTSFLILVLLSLLGTVYKFFLFVNNSCNLVSIIILSIGVSLSFSKLILSGLLFFNALFISSFIISSVLLNETDFSFRKSLSIFVFKKNISFIIFSIKILLSCTNVLLVCILLSFILITELSSKFITSFILLFGILLNIPLFINIFQISALFSLSEKDSKFFILNLLFSITLNN